MAWKCIGLDFGGQVRATQRITMTTQEFCCPSMRQKYDDGSGTERYSERIEPSCDSDHKQARVKGPYISFMNCFPAAI